MYLYYAIGSSTSILRKEMCLFCNRGNRPFSSTNMKLGSPRNMDRVDSFQIYRHCYSCMTSLPEDTIIITLLQLYDIITCKPHYRTTRIQVSSLYFYFKPGTKSKLGIHHFLSFCRFVFGFLILSPTLGSGSTGGRGKSTSL
jgi:hypothetical protein